MTETPMARSSEGRRVTLAEWVRRYQPVPLTEPQVNEEFALVTKTLIWDANMVIGRSGAIYTGREMG